MRVISLNANGIRAAARKGFFEWMQKVNPDIVCIQETKAHASQLSDECFHPKDYSVTYVDAQKKGYSGVAIYSRKPPQNVIQSLAYDVSDNEGRYLQYDYSDGLCIISLYLPSASSGDIRQSVKYEFLQKFEAHLKYLQNTYRSVIICGDFNIVHKEIDIKNWKANQKNSGCLPEERAWLDKIFNQHGWIDAFRTLNQAPHHYTWWSNRGQAWANNVGWRIDYQVVSPNLVDKISAVDIYKSERFSDHAPLIIDYND